jgi:hypothetical protein
MLWKTAECFKVTIVKAYKNLRRRNTMLKEYRKAESKAKPL